jgi:hypothetical protein
MRQGSKAGVVIRKIGTLTLTAEIAKEAQARKIELKAS